MPRIELQNLSNDARIWIFGISPALDERQSALLLSRIDPFLDQWAAHGTPITSARELREGSFLVVAVDKRSETSGCSIDKMFGTLKQLEQELAVTILDSTRVFQRDTAGKVAAVPRKEFRSTATADTVVFDVLAERLGDVREGAWERRAADSWHKALVAQ
ncbi:MAG TPA: hypothetical protein VGF69_08640 [Thermoanaerobaculia bacterium]|jgi:hypothetical protein